MKSIDKFWKKIDILILNVLVSLNGILLYLFIFLSLS